MSTDRAGAMAAGALPRLPGLDVLRVIGAGGFGRVYAAYHHERNQLVAVKVLRPDLSADPVRRGQFRREFEAVERLRDPGIVTVYEFREDAGRAWFVMELLTGPTLDELFREGQPGDEVVALVLPAARALKYAHDRNVYHLDVSPANVKLDDDGSPVVLDFGLAAVGEARAALWSSPGYTPYYSAPEARLAPNPDIRHLADVYSVGALLYRGLTGRHPPLDGVSEPHAALPNASPDLRAVCLTCLAAAPDRRYRYMSEVVDDLTRVANHEPAAARPKGCPERAARWVGRHRWQTAVAVAVAVLMVGAVVWYQQRREENLAGAAKAEAERVARLATEGDEAFRAGHWGEAAAYYAGAIAAGHPAAGRLRVRRLQALFAAGRVAEVEAEVGPAEAHPTTADYRGALLLLRAGIEFLDPTRTAAGRTSARRALEAPGLTPADAAYARGLLAGPATEMLAEFQRAVSLDPLHHPAQTAAVTSLVVTGRYEEARALAEFLRVRFPDDPLPDFVGGLADLLGGRPADGLARMEKLAARLDDARGAVLRGRTRALADRLAAVRETSAKAGMTPPRMRSPHLPLGRGQIEVVSAMTELLRTAGLPPLPSPVAARLVEPGEAYQRVTRRFFEEGKHAEAAEEAEEAFSRDPDASLAAFASGARFVAAAPLYFKKNPADKPRLEAELWRVADLGERAAAAPSRYGDSFRYEGRLYAALALAALCQPDEFAPGTAPAARRRFAAAAPGLIDEGAAFPGMRHQGVTQLVLSKTLDPTQSRTVLAVWASADPTERQPRGLLVMEELRFGNYRAAREAAAAAAADFPDDARFRGQLETLVGPLGPAPVVPPAAP